MRTATLLLLGAAAVASALFDPSANDNIVVYYGQGPNQLGLLHYCQQPSIDLIVLSFVHLFPAQANGYPGTNFGNRCWGDVYDGPGYGGVDDDARDQLQRSCPSLNADIPACQATYGKKILLSLGGGVLDYQLDGARDGRTLANLLWFMFGPRNEAWAARGLPRPFDSEGVVVEVDGFDLDIEHPSADGSAGYDELVTQLRALFKFATKDYYLTGSPQCVVPDANMAAMINATAFDMLFIQFYNTPQCSAATWAALNSGWDPESSEDDGPDNSAFTYDDWAEWVLDTPSRDAKLFIGLPGSDAAAAAGNAVDEDGVRRLVAEFGCREEFGGVAIWEATYSEGNVVDGKVFHDMVKEVLEEAGGCGMSIS